MNPSSNWSPRTCLAAAALALSLPVWAQGAPAAGESSYQRDRAACAAISAPADRTNCLRDVGAAHAQARKSGRRSGPSAEELTRNALQRCQAHKSSDQRLTCERMARGEGTVSGSVQGGGTIRELVTQEPMPPAAAPSPPMTPLPPASPPMVSPPPSMPMPPPAMNPAPAPLPPAGAPMPR